MKRTDKAFFDANQEKLIRDSLLAGAPEFEIERFIITCERTGLDPFSRQIYGHLQNKKSKKPGTKDQYEWTKTVAIITSIDGFRAIAERSGGYRGQTAPEWYYLDEEGKSGWHDVFITARDKSGNPLRCPEACRVGVLRENFAGPCYGVANFDSFAKFFKEDGGGWVLDTFWKKMPEHMIAKVAEAQAIRKAFPLLACGLFVEEEVSKTEEEEQPAPGKVIVPDETKWAAGASPEERAAKAAAKKPVEHAPEPEPEPEKPKAAPKPTKKAVAAPEPPEEEVPEEETEEDADAGEGGDESDAWRNYAISQITIARFQGKKLGDLSFEDIKGLKEGWCDKYAEKIKNNPAKVVESDAIIAAYQALKS